jgi:hypothetical protein
LTSAQPPAWATQVPFAPVLNPQPLAASSTQTGLSSQQVQAMQQQLLQSIWQGFLQIVDGFLMPDTQASDQLAAWWTDTQTTLNSFGAAISKSLMTFQNLVNGVLDTTDQDVTDLITALNDTATNATNAQGAWITVFTDLGFSVTDATTYVTWLQGTGTAANNALTQIEDFLTTGDWSDLSTAIQDILQSIFGSSTSLGLVGSIPAPAVVNVTQNLQPVWDFPDAASLSGAGTAWSWDGSEDHTGTAGSGSAKVVANGVLQALKGIPGAVQPAQVVTPTAYVMWSGLTYTGSNPIQLQLIPYSQSGSELVAGTAFEVAQIASPASSGSWTHLTGTYTVPSSGVAAVQLRLVVGGNATAGSVWWDDCEANLSGGFLADLQSDTNNIIDSFAPSGTSAEFLTGVTNLLALFGLTPADIGGATVIETVWTDIINDFINPLNVIEQSAINGLTDVWDWLTGTPTPTSSTQVAATKVTNVLGGSSLGADVSTVHTVATDGSSWSTRLTNDLLVLSDVFHLTYAAGTSTDPPGTLSGGKPTWYSCWNDLLALTGVVNSVTAPTDTAPTTGASITAASAAATTAGTNASMALTNAATVATTAQAITDGIYQSQNGGSSTGNPTSSIVPSLTAIPASNIVGATGAAVTFGAVGGGNSANLSSATSGSISWTHTIATGDLSVLVFTTYSPTAGSTGYTSSVTYGGTAMTMLQRQASSVSGGAAFAVTEAWWLKAPASGSKTVVVSVSGTSTNFGPISGDSVSYFASKVGTVGPNTGGGSSTLSMSAASTTGNMVVGAFGVSTNFSGLPTLSAYTKTQRYNSFGLVIGDAAGASSVSFGATASGTAANVQWAGITVELTN